ncbi:MAG: alkaline phosphatase family protein [Gammaproteobacteria bacterium]|nr:alkaline phosphatase family protein [Gammaproteobacteria bacterium]
MNLPNYEKNNIVNLMSAIAQSFDRKSIYKPTDLISIETLKYAKNIVLIIIDGLGYEFMTRQGQGSFLHEHLVGQMTSVFPTTTASAITSFATGVAPQQHAFSGWFLWYKELGTLCASLPFAPRIGGTPFDQRKERKIKIKPLLGADSFSDQLGTSTYLIIKKDIIHSSFNKTLFSKSKKFPYNSLTGFFTQIKKAISDHTHKKFIHAYWPTFDALSHKHGVQSDVVKKHFEEIDKKIRNLAKNVKNTKTTLIVTADHGLIDTSPERIMRLEHHPKLQECLVIPLCGEPRVNYCYVRPDKTKQFEDYVNSKLDSYVTLHKSADLIGKNYFGLFDPNPKLLDRIGDYTLIAKENYIFTDQLMGEMKHKLTGVHGGLSNEELFIPLIVT